MQMQRVYTQPLLECKWINTWHATNKCYTGYFIAFARMIIKSARVTRGSSGLCCCVRVTSFERWLTPFVFLVYTVVWLGFWMAGGWVARAICGMFAVHSCRCMMSGLGSSTHWQIQTELRKRLFSTWAASLLDYNTLLSLGVQNFAFWPLSNTRYAKRKKLIKKSAVNTSTVSQSSKNVNAQSENQQQQNNIHHYVYPRQRMVAPFSWDRSRRVRRSNARLGTV